MEKNDALSGQEAMPEENKPQNDQPETHPPERTGDMEALLKEEGYGLDLPKQGEIRTGVIARMGPNEVLVSIGTKSEGIITGRELELIPPDEMRTLTIGTEIPVYVVIPEDQNGNVVLSYMRAREERDWMRAEHLLSSGEIYEGKIIGFNKGGLIVPIGGLRGFVPASQISALRRVDAGAETPEQRWGKMVGEPIMVRVIEVDRERRRLILSERMALQETRETLKDRLLEELQEGAIRTGRVTSLADFGAFVNIDGADGLVHLSEISWERIQHPNEVLKVGQEVKVKVISMDRERKRIGLSIRQLLPDPWLKKIEGLREGQLIEGTITHLTKFGAFARLSEDLEGLIHVSELSEQRIAHPKEVVKEGEVVTLRIIKIDPERRRIGLSLRKVDSPAYADLDWKMALAGEISEVAKEAPSETSLLVVAAPETEAQPPAEEQAVVETMPPAEEQPAVETMPPVEEQVVVETIPPAEEQPAVETMPPAEEQVVVETIPPTEEQPAVETLPPAEEQVVVETIPPAEEPPMVEAKPPQEEQPIVEAQPPLETTPAEAELPQPEAVAPSGETQAAVEELPEVVELPVPEEVSPEPKEEQKE
jgi:small subunit ribosomal protein S1